MLTCDGLGTFAELLSALGSWGARRSALPAAVRPVCCKLLLLQAILEGLCEILHAGKCLRFHCPGVPRKARTPSERRQPSLRPPCPVPIFPPPAKLPKFHFAKLCPALICLPMPWAVLPCCFAHGGSLHLKALPFLATQYSGPSFQTQSPAFISSRKAAPGCPPGAEPSLLHPEIMVTGVTGTHPMIAKIVMSVISLAPTQTQHTGCHTPFSE